ncbi:MAG: ATPase, T2SS/T4P/T4SS family [Anaerolineae bacterium]
MSDDTNGVYPQTDDQTDEPQPELLTSLIGRTISIDGLVERILTQFDLEHGEGQSDAIRSATSDVERRKLVRDTAEYVFGVESLQLSPHDQARLISRAYSEIFGYGALDDLFADPTITTISLDGVRHVGVRYSPAQELQALEPLFEDTPHMHRVIQRLLRHAGAELRDDIPIIEAGLTVGQRRVSLSVATPPFVPEMAVDMRLHPAQLPALDDWVTTGILNEETATLLQAIIQSKHGLIIVGDTESGKTTLLAMLLQALDGAKLATVERAGELHLPYGSRQLVVQWPYNDQVGVTFGKQILNALALPDIQHLAIDEIRADEPHAIKPLLSDAAVPRQIWSFRGTADPKRLVSALGMLARMANSSQPEHMVNQLYRRLPFIVILKRSKDKLRVREIAEWQFPDTSTDDETSYADYIPLMQMGWDDDACQPTGNTPQHALALDDAFWHSES